MSTMNAMRKTEELHAQTRYRMLEALSGAERKAQQRVEKLRDVVFELDNEGNITFLNPAWERLTGYTIEHSLGEKMSAFVICDDKESYRSMVRTQNNQDYFSAAQNDNCLEEIRLERKDQTPIWVSLSIAFLSEDLRIGVIHDLSERKKAEQLVHDANLVLEDRIQERTKELRATHAKLIDASRVAGMAEHATGILHNVGNVLNSVMVASSLLAQKLNQPMGHKIVEAVELLNPHADELASLDPKAAKVLVYLTKIGEQISKQRADFVDELKGLHQNLEHIKAVIGHGQSVAKSSGVVEETSVQDLINTAVESCRYLNEQHHIELSLSLESVPVIEIDRHQVLQILVNLLRNAQDALIEDETKDVKCIKVTATLNAEHRLVFSIWDNGPGIDEANLTKIFSHGFTTKKNGHGFGLHSCANMATAMGGELSCARHEEKWTVFSLQLPVNERGENG